jgi:hypothetical protein
MQQKVVGFDADYNNADLLSKWLSKEGEVRIGIKHHMS